MFTNPCVFAPTRGRLAFQTGRQTVRAGPALSAVNSVG